ncbi:MAG TPA: crosslink repair DNA glycosylase YcaQ family protein [Actinophytocola sp.]|uniref:DNA glycosylase AlkZ-like family protein n=1 Tax=Actinophytocola sp. TaxID=1872138 RepID=UPI002DBA49D5|nr:crosslink repair DNA glycosylase YcaQ family protein [Actinophytocola sp.]HEU5470323.1 crosslink repair DNA glycosylase YcaQ family protein [Actinophytocola sp.]
MRAEVDVGGFRAYARNADLDELRATEPNRLVRLLPAFQYVIAVNRALIPAEHRARVGRTAGWISPVVLSGGRIAGVWTAEHGRVRVEPFEDIPARALAAEIDGIGLAS